MLTEKTADIECPDCGEEVAQTDEEDVFECRRCGHRFTRDEYIESVAERIRAAGFDGLAERLDAAAERDREVES